MDHLVRGSQNDRSEERMNNYEWELKIMCKDAMWLDYTCNKKIYELFAWLYDRQKGR